MALEVWRADFSVPFRYTGDANFNAMLIKGTLEHGWWFTNPSLGAPFGQQLYDFAGGSINLDLGLIRLLGFVLPNYVVVMNVFFLLTFPLSALSAYAVLRWGRLSAPVACTCAVLYALAPYHFRRGEGHLFLAADFAVPLGAYLVLGVATGRAMFMRRDRSGVRSLLSKQSLLTLTAVAIVASAGDGFYYAAFTVILLVAMTAVRAAATRRIKEGVAGIAITALLALACIASLAPTLAYAASHGQNGVVAVRKPAESEVYSLKLAQLLLPRDNHRVGLLASLESHYATTTQPKAPSEVYDASLGTIGAAGFVWLLAVVAVSALGSRRRLPRVVRDSRPAAVAAATALLVGSTGGLSSLFAYLVTPQLRAWNRISIFIAFFSLLAIGLLLERARHALRGSGRRRALFAALLTTVVAVGFADQTAPADVPNYAVVAARYRADAGFVRSIESVLPHGAMVFELPYQAFPEGAKIGGVDRYDPVRPYLHSTYLRWSYGAMVGRTEDWQPFLIGRPVNEVVAGVAAAGFSGLYVDLAGYGRSGRALTSTLHRLLGVRPLASTDRRFLFYDLRHYAQRLLSTFDRQAIMRLRTATLSPPRVEADSGVTRIRFGNATAGQRWTVSGRQASVNLREPSSSESVVVLLRVSVDGVSPSRFPIHVALTWPGGATTDALVWANPVPVRQRVRLEHGNNVLRIEVEQGWAPGLRLRFRRTRFALQAFAPFAGPPS